MPASTSARDMPGKAARKNRRERVKRAKKPIPRRCDGDAIPPSPLADVMDGLPPRKRIESHVLRLVHLAADRPRSGRSGTHKHGRSFAALPFQSCTTKKYDLLLPRSG